MVLQQDEGSLMVARGFLCIVLCASANVVGSLWPELPWESHQKPHG